VNVVFLGSLFAIADYHWLLEKLHLLALCAGQSSSFFQEHQLGHVGTTKGERKTSNLTYT
jgi:hypothetical protein